MPNRILCYERIAALASVPDWKAHQASETIYREFQFADKDTADHFIEQVRLLEKGLKHPAHKISQEDARVSITLMTSAVGGLSEMDMEMAQAIDDLLLTHPEYRR